MLADRRRQLSKAMCRGRRGARIPVGQGCQTLRKSPTTSSQRQCPSSPHAPRQQSASFSQVPLRSAWHCPSRQARAEGQPQVEMQRAMSSQPVVLVTGISQDQWGSLALLSSAARNCIVQAVPLLASHAPPHDTCSLILTDRMKHLADQSRRWVKKLTCFLPPLRSTYHWQSALSPRTRRCHSRSTSGAPSSIVVASRPRRPHSSEVHHGWDSASDWSARHFDALC